MVIKARGTARYVPCHAVEREGQEENKGSNLCWATFNVCNLGRGTQLLLTSVTPLQISDNICPACLPRLWGE